MRSLTNPLGSGEAALAVLGVAAVGGLTFWAVNKAQNTPIPVAGSVNNEGTFGFLASQWNAIPQNMTSTDASIGDAVAIYDYSSQEYDGTVTAIDYNSTPPTYSIAITADPSATGGQALISAGSTLTGVPISYILWEQDIASNA